MRGRVAPRGHRRSTTAPFAALWAILSSRELRESVREPLLSRKELPLERGRDVGSVRCFARARDRSKRGRSIWVGSVALGRAGLENRDHRENTERQLAGLGRSGGFTLEALLRPCTEVVERGLPEEHRATVPAPRDGAMPQPPSLREGESRPLRRIAGRVPSAGRRKPSSRGVISFWAAAWREVVLSRANIRTGGRR